PDNKDTGEDLKTRIEHITTHLQSGDCTKDEHAALKQETTQLEEQFEYLTLLTNIHSLTPDSYPEALAQAEALARRKSKNPLYHSAKWVADTLNEPVYRSARKIVVEKVTDLETKLRKGEFPIPHCQNWRDNSSLNVSLLSFTADANKNTYHISEYSNGVTRPNTESEVRLVGWQSSPTLLIENIYSSEWNDEYGIALLGTIAQEALNLYTNTKANEVRIAAPLDSGHDGHTTNISVLNAMRTFCKQYGLELQEGYMELSPPESKATKEYYDSGPGIVKSGSDVTLGNVAYITISTEID
ncbi:hypothetical protein CMO92_05085, partial [Candidatus Woesearchaeota archaeon]|nr:hypothetical protein [Candidatus Woesearchaeota archaeon]